MRLDVVMAATFRAWETVQVFFFLEVLAFRDVGFGLPAAASSQARSIQLGLLEDENIETWRLSTEP